jgi:serine/threonine-protein phosphatase 2A regulatory subunit A
MPVMPCVFAESIDEEDEVLLALSEELGNLVEYVGGPEHASVLLTPLETLATVEETMVRDKAMESLNKVARTLSVSHVLEYFVPLVRRLASNDWFTSRIAACGLFAVVYARLPPDAKGEFRTCVCQATGTRGRGSVRPLRLTCPMPMSAGPPHVEVGFAFMVPVHPNFESPSCAHLPPLRSFTQLCHDDTPMVRRAAAANLGKLATAVHLAGETALLKSELLPLFTALSSDEQDSVRLLAVQNCVSIAKVLSIAENQAVVLPIVRAVSQDSSWRVRYVAAEHLCELVPSLGARPSPIIPSAALSTYAPACASAAASRRSARATACAQART